MTSLLGRRTESDRLRYGRGSALRSGAERRPVVVWNSTRRCNLPCAHCSSDSTSSRYAELTHEEALAFLTDIAQFGAPALLLSAGEPLMRERVFDLIDDARRAGLAVTLSTNGTLVTPDAAGRLADLGVRYVGISLDGIGATHDAFRGRTGAFERSMRGIRALTDAGVPVGVRVTLTPTAVASLPELFALVEREGISRACFYRLVPSGRGRGQAPVVARRTRAVVERIFDWAGSLIARDIQTTVLTVDDYADGPALYLRMAARDPERAESIRRALSWNGGAQNASGRGLAPSTGRERCAPTSSGADRRSARCAGGRSPRSGRTLPASSRSSGGGGSSFTDAAAAARSCRSAAAAWPHERSPPRATSTPPIRGAT